MAASSPGASPGGNNRTVTVITRIVYHGVDAKVNRAASALTFGEFLAAASAIFNGYHERNFLAPRLRRK